MKNPRKRIVVTESECSDCGNIFHDIKRFPLERCPHCDSEVTFFNSETISEKSVVVEIDFKTGEATLIRQ